MVSRFITISLSLMLVIFFTTSIQSIAQTYTFSYTYQNVTRVNGGGTLEPGDIIEVRALMMLTANKKSVTKNLYYLDTIATGFNYVANSMKIITNEGNLFLGTYTDNSNDDLGAYTTLPGGYRVLRINIGTGAPNVSTTDITTNTGGGTVKDNTNLPKKSSTEYLFLVAYQLQVTATIGDILYPTGTFYFTDNSGSKKTEHSKYPGIMVTPNQALCNNFSSASFTAESSFGSGNTQNRSAGTINVPGYNIVNMGPSDPKDGNFAIANNTSADGTTDNTGPYQPTANSHRVFNGFWDIIGDHTGAADPAAGNLPAAAGTNGGYMLVVNAAFPTGEAYSDIVSGLCPNTYYEFSAWLRNICGNCGIDQDGISSYTPGVLPNLAFTINDIDYYTTGNMQYNKKWEKRGFIYKTGPTETSFKITIKNNAPGGGGDDWVLDDISLATCYPNLIMSPSDTAKVCKANIVNLYDTVRSYFNTYTNYCWEKSTDGGNTWIGTGVCGTKTPVLKDGMWEYVIDTTFYSVAADSGTYYRVKVATTKDNLTDVNCSVNNSQKVFLKVYNYDCSVLADILKNISVRKSNSGIPSITWATLNEEGIRNFELQRSIDGKSFTTIHSTLPLYNNGGIYQHEDPIDFNGTVYYRIQINGKKYQSAYSKIVSLYHLNNVFSVKANNPFNTKLQLDVQSSTGGVMDIKLMDSYGRMVLRKSFSATRGNNVLFINDVSNLPAGMYVVTISINNQTIQQKLIKNN